mgnify:CR=1 FL=1
MRFLRLPLAILGILMVLMGLLCVALYFYKQSMILAVIVLAPLYIAAIGRKRGLHAIILIVVMAAATAGLVLSFPDKLGAYALRLPVIAPLLEQIGLLAPNFILIDKHRRIRGVYNGTLLVEIERIKEDIAILKKEE